MENKQSIILLNEIGLERNRALMRETKGIIYKITNIINNKIYIGQTTLSFYRRYRDGFKKCHNAYLQRSIDKYGLNNFKVEILAKNKSIKELDKLEIELINEYDSCNPEHGYNMKTGGGNGKHTEESLKRISKATRGKNKGKDNKNSKKTIIVYKGEKIIKDSRSEMIDYMKEKYNLSVLCWFDKGITYKYQKDVEVCGYLNDDGTINECNRNMSIAESSRLGAKKSAKKARINYKGNIMDFESKEALIEYMNREYNISCANWFSRAGRIPTIYQEDVISCGYLNEDGTVEECIRSDKKRGQEHSKKIQVIYKGEKIVKESMRQMNEFLSEKGILGANGWYIYGMPVKYQKDITSFGYINEDNTIDECKRSKGTNKKIKAVLNGKIIIKNSKKEFIDFMRSKYKIKVSNGWFSEQGVPFEYQEKFSSIGYLNEDGTVEECKRKSKAKGEKKKKKRVIVYKGNVIIKESMKEMSDYFKDNYSIENVSTWFYNKVPKAFEKDVTYCGFYDDYDGKIE
ncbi:TPA: GIY-YIG nuclease family protein [Clostridium perfringens]|uniref:GIY-YIG nuclease family protein n=1 Tax=Clostridium perfringens TaxID=1502 RepID=UPI0013A6790A|nr:GIY-YIG nuclease family protein [Clostridium perfringens]